MTHWIPKTCNICTHKEWATGQCRRRWSTDSSLQQHIQHQFAKGRPQSIQSETVDDLLHCTIAKEMWSIAFMVYGVLWIMLGQVTDLLMICRGVFGCHCKRVVWKATPDCIMRTIGRERNHWIFENEEQSMQDMKNIFFKIFVWILYFNWGVSCGSIVDILDHMSVCL